MSVMYPILMVVQVISSLSIIVLVLLQQGKGSEMGAAFGSGSAGSLFGAAGAANFLSRSTRWAAIFFFASTLGLAYVSSGRSSSSLFSGGSVTDTPAATTVTEVPAAIPTPAEVPASGNTSSETKQDNAIQIPSGAKSDSGALNLSIPPAAPAQPKP